DDYLSTDLIRYFPRQMAARYRDQIGGHRLRREIIATQLANDTINRGGPTFVSRLQDLTGRAPSEIVEAFVLVRDGFELNGVYESIDALDNRIPGPKQLEFYSEVS